MRTGLLCEFLPYVDDFFGSWFPKSFIYKTLTTTRDFPAFSPLGQRLPMSSQTHPSLDKQSSNTEQLLEEAMQNLEIDYNNPSLSRVDYEQMSYETLVSLAICQDLSSRLKINSLEVMLQQETMKKESLANLLDQERTYRTRLEEHAKQTEREIVGLEVERASLKADLVQMKRRERARKIRKQRREKQTRKLEQDSGSLDDVTLTVDQQSKPATIEESGTNQASTEHATLKVSQPSQGINKEDRRYKTQAAQEFERFRLQFEEFLRQKLPHLLDSFHTIVGANLTAKYAIDNEEYLEVN